MVSHPGRTVGVVKVAFVLVATIVLAWAAPATAKPGADRAARKACALNAVIDDRMFDRGDVVGQTDYARVRKALAKSRVDGAAQIRRGLSMPSPFVEKEQARLGLADWCADLEIAPYA